MGDQQIKKAAKILVEYSTKIKKGEVVQIVADNAAQPLALEVYKLVLKKGAYPIVHMSLPESSYYYYKFASEEQLKNFPKIRMHELKNTDAVIYLGA
ncbi:aminopeptidase, partial [Candidatus Woesearchaeota archaeon]|nr:aminopeptidase [Candidatus Woesearchaeota archaeon]